MIYNLNWFHVRIFGGFAGGCARLCRLQVTMRQAKNPDIG
jgi:hypothetical protein